MRTRKGLMAGLVLAGIFVWGLNPLFAGQSKWPHQKGELCWNNSNGEKVRLAVVRTVGNHYLVHGLVTETEATPESTSLVNGNAVWVGDQILMHFSASGATIGSASSHGELVEEVHGTVGRVVFDAASLIGKATGVVFHCDQGQTPQSQCQFDLSYSGVLQILTPTRCSAEMGLNGLHKKP